VGARSDLSLLWQESNICGRLERPQALSLIDFV
jgi:hypothetical protein